MRDRAKPCGRRISRPSPADVAGHSIAIVGAGIGGLTAALALARDGHTITLIERRTGFREIGAGLQLSPNASGILLRLGLGPALRRVATEPDRVVVRAFRSGAVIGEIALGAFMRERFGAPYWLVHRADLQRILLDAVRSSPGVRLVMGRKVEQVADGASAANLTLVTLGGISETLAFDAVVGADGVWSKVRHAVGEPKPPIFRGYVAWRAIIPRDGAPPALRGNETGLWLGSDGHVVHYPIAGGRFINIVAIERRQMPVEGWAAPGDGALLLARFERASPMLRQLLKQPAEWHLWSLYDRRAQSFAGRRIALIGDAAHPVLPFLAQGAALAIEDVDALALLLRSRPVSAAFRAYAAQRIARVQRVQDDAQRNGRIYHAGALTSFARNRVMRRLGPEGMTQRYAWLYGFRASLAPERTDR
jgi:salicylate hydroxylase